MRSLVAVAAIALAGTFDTVAAAADQCTPGGPRPPLTSWMSHWSQTKTMSSKTQTSLSGSIETSLSSSIDISASLSLSTSLSASDLTDTKTGSATTPNGEPTATTGGPIVTPTGGARVIKNEISNGNFARSNPDGSIPAWEVRGDVQVIVGPGYTGDGSVEKGCAAMKATDESSGNGLDKRADNPFAGISQNIFNLQPTTLYTVRFFYLVITAPTAGFNICQLNAYLGGSNFYSSFIVSMGSSIQWNTVLTQVPATAAFAPFGISINCFSGGLSFVYVDSIFMSNQVTPDTINNYQLDFGGSNTGSSTTTTGATTSGISSTVSGSAASASNGTPVTTGSLTGTASLSSAANPSGTGSAVTSGSLTGTAASGSASSATGSAASGTVTGTATGSTISGQQTAGSSTATQSGGSQASGQSGTQTQSTQQTGTVTSAQNPSQTGTQTQGSGTSTQSTSQPSVQPVSRICANVGNSPIDGRLCGVHPYNSANVYRILPSGPIQKEECAAVCLSDPKCNSFEWKYNTDNCGNECRLSTRQLRQDNVGTIGSTFEAYDRSCAYTIPCGQYPPDALCLNRIGDTPAAGCSKRMGTLKSCTKPMLQFSISPCSGTDSCRHMCNTYPGCKSFSYTTLTSTNNCKLYTGTTEEIAATGGNTYFQDLSCFACGENMGWSTYGLVTNDQYELPENTCVAPTSSISGSTTTRTTTSSTLNTANSIQTDSTLTPTKTVWEDPGTTSGAVSTDPIPCPRYFAPPGFCSGFGIPAPAQTGSIEGTKGTTTKPQRICSAHGIKRGTYNVVPRSIYPRQDYQAECALLCYRQNTCKSFAMGTDPLTGAKQCYLSNNMVAEDGIDLGVDGSVYWEDVNCYSCVKCDIPWGAAQTTTTTTTATTSLSQTTSTATGTATGTDTGTATGTGTSTAGSIDGTTTTSTTASSTSTPSSGALCPVALEQGCHWNQYYAVNSTLSCARNGRFQPPDTFYLEGGTYPEQMHQELCSAICNEFPNTCKASAWDNERSRCIFSYRSINDLTKFEPAAFNPPTASYAWTEQTCITCPCEVDTPASLPSTTTTTSQDSQPTPGGGQDVQNPGLEDVEDCANPYYVLTPSPPGHPRICGLHARQTQVPIGINDYIEVESANECAAFCLSSPTCKTFAHHVEQSWCLLFDETPAELGLEVDDNVGSQYYNRECYACPQAA